MGERHDEQGASRLGRSRRIEGAREAKLEKKRGGLRERLSPGASSLRITVIPGAMALLLVAEGAPRRPIALHPTGRDRAHAPTSNLSADEVECVGGGGGGHVSIVVAVVAAAVAPLAAHLIARCATCCVPHQGGRAREDVENSAIRRGGLYRDGRRQDDEDQRRRRRDQDKDERSRGGSGTGREGDDALSADDFRGPTLRAIQEAKLEPARLSRSS